MVAAYWFIPGAVDTCNIGGGRVALGSKPPLASNWPGGVLWGGGP